jgi:intracellular sulfur oxidation DsrE/DsrF family protein
MNHEISDEILSAHIDNELDPTERARLLERIAVDASVRSRACELWQLKQMVRGAYPLPRACFGLARGGFAAPRWTHALAASLFLAVGSITGWLAHGHSDQADLLASQIDTIRAEGGRVVLHLFSGEPARMKASLQTAEQLANTRDNYGNPFRVEFIANGAGLHLLRDGGSPYAAQVVALSRYSNVRFIACDEAMDRMRERGIDVSLLPGVEVAPSAESELAARLTQGWRYIQS